jgi:hypothetical protein
MGPKVKSFLEDLEEDSFEDSKQLATVLEDLFDKKTKTVEEYETELRKIRKAAKENVASYYLRFLYIAKKAEETREDKRITLFVNGIRPIALYKEMKKHLVSTNPKLPPPETLLQVYRLALDEELEYNRLQKVIAEDHQVKAKERERRMFAHWT